MKRITLLAILLSSSILSSQGQWINADLSGYRWQMGSTVIGSKVFYAGGDWDDCLSTFDIYDHGSGQTITSNMSVDRRMANVTNSGSKVLVAGGVDDLSQVTDVVDIYDTATQAWTVAQLSVARFGISTVSNGTVALFAGGTSFPPMDSSYSTVDIYNGGTGTWTTANLSVPRGLMAAVVADNKAFFAGGYPEGGGASDRVDIFDFATGTWSTATLSMARWGLAAAAAGNKVLFAGGQNGTGVGLDRVDIYDLTTATWSTASLSIGRSFSGGEYATSVCGKAVFVGGCLINETTGNFDEDYSEIDVYDAATGTWSVGQLPYDLVAHSTNAIDDQILVAGGGTIVGAVFQLYDVVRIWEDGCTVGINDRNGQSSFFSVFPNPANEQLTVLLVDPTKANYQLIDGAGRIVQQGLLIGERNVVPTAHLDRGMYTLRLESNGIYANERIILQ